MPAPFWNLLSSELAKENPQTMLTGIVDRH